MIPTVYSEKLILRPFQPEDASKVQALAGEKVIAEMTDNVPHPYLDGMAEEWIGKHQSWYRNRVAIVFAILTRETCELIGAISITEICELSGNLGYWIGLPYWGKGYCSEASQRIIEFGFSEFGLSLICAKHLTENLASGKVIKKSGFKYLKNVVVGGRELQYYELEKAQWQSDNKVL
ncbi:GNAT family N-acetyltransferase [Rheinheimera hassiensis]|uniref:GNAT family N-acetyltransferase n=1 Tax=Rheinheimera hassiensis TaxID=1193627 RepID=UPI001F0519B5|nr:GNAT family N-acetyltransferase [Rheinheimera hassiensis]